MGLGLRKSRKMRRNTKRRTSGRRSTSAYSSRKTQKLWNMKGCAHNKYKKCAKCVKLQLGGSCGCDKIVGGMKGCIHNKYKKCAKCVKLQLGGSCGCDKIVGGMKGCIHNKYNKCAKCVKLQLGGSCGCDKIGGNSFLPSSSPSSSPSPPPSNSLQTGGCGCGQPLNVGAQTGGNSALIGSPWTASINGWPGVAGVAGQTNYYSLNEYKGLDPQTNVILERGQVGGTTKKQGGGLIPQDLVNLGRNMMFGVGSAYNSLSGYQAPVSPMPYKNQLMTQSSAKTLGYL